MKIATEFQNIKTNYKKTISRLSGLPYSQKAIIRMVEFYSSSKYLNGQKDELGREKPFYNVGNAMCDVENAAKDIDTKDCAITSDDGNHYTQSNIMSKDVYEWMKATNFAKTLNDMRDTHTRYGSLLVKKCMYDEDGKKVLKIEIPEWKNVMNDQVDMLGGAIVEVHWMTPMEITKKTEWDEKAVKEIIKKAAKEGSGKRIPVFEIRGEFPKSFIKELDNKKPSEKDDYTFSYQLYYMAGEVADQSEEVSFSDKLTPLYWEDDTEKVYKYLARKKKSGIAFGTGVIEEGEEAQVWTNDAVMKQFRAMEYTTKVVGQTASKKLKGRNLLNEVDDGQILEIEPEKPVVPMNLLPAGGLGQYGLLIQQWYAQFEKTTSAYAAQRGETPPSGTPFRLQAAVLQQSGGVFQDLQEELGIFVTECFQDKGWIMDHLASQLNAEHILAHEYSMEELKEIDGNFSTYEANEKAKYLILSQKIVSAEDYEEAVKLALETIGKTKSSRFLNVPKNYYKFKSKVTFNVTGEQRNKAAVLESLSNILTVYATNPAIAQDPVLMQIFMKIVELSGAGISPVSLQGAIAEQAKMMQEQQLQQAQQAQQPGQPKQPKEMSLAATGGAKV